MYIYSKTVACTEYFLESRKASREPSFASMALPKAEDRVSVVSKNGVGVMDINGMSVEGLSIGGQETCIILPSLKVAFDIGRCPQRAISQEFLFISHSHMDHIGGIAMYVATRGLYKLRSPTIVVPSCIKATVEKLFEVHRELDGSELKHQLVGLDVGGRRGYIIYSVKQKLKPEYIGLSANEIKRLKFEGVEITNTIKTPEVAFTGDTKADFVLDELNIDALNAKLLIMEATFVDDAVTVEHARSFGHLHLSEIVELAEKFQNKGILLIHFSARYGKQDIIKAIDMLPVTLRDRIYGLTQGF